MDRFLIQGGASLEGEVVVSGAKNAALKLLAAALLTKERCSIHNVPNIADVRTMLEILRKLGANITFENGTVTIQASQLALTKPDYQLVKHMRASLVIVGPMLARLGEVILPHPGGCLIGARPINTHTNALAQLGVSLEQKDDLYHFRAPRLLGARVVLDEMSVSATENVLLAACLADGKTEIHLAASEPEIVDLAKFLKSMGAKIQGEGTSVISVEGVRELHGAEHHLIPDRMEAGTLAIAAAVSRGDVRIKKIIPDHLDAVLNVFRKANVSFALEEHSGLYATLHVKPTTIFEPVHIDTRPYPGFPTDLQAPCSVLMTQARGTSKIFETMYDSRLGYIKELVRMGAIATVVDSHTAVIEGPTALTGKRITSLDIRAGATLLIAALIAQGESVLEHVELIDRGYENIDERLKNLGANIQRQQTHD
ncbi:MAG: UDP-N-acetylglucosamine 1-carboxyvinyltransferase [Candidatus Kerfeldbacteria bacterium RIFCSPLOWO2_01_FULL_48_11]|uniref:UDP-N-acetylglucosamine 1-carboxyvinyltransferase n=1 Tax=Candidatus Kerfeldbacteria bacterium RIFCSPLOWO2_01_FULL_48_11 TaxID=1798543 RepID=A0A1G2B780_9BACT|nr:MAG: UDP-N-acetylglucosamine 1-carboxyvinyltransferase [Parcubacteria group bacterium GW2011_GWC2_49_9]OGY85068.1 MAG: UDP-N-acetylglucosamine 1-carboxyvinyltransferase [Candidatus Kerfeldbacteria bacterium RIFCSPLOWO2_01_FULL_48_11]HCJ52377.1 UDP-N-acetylglucosamine 1-carboxyvinyltransferase [Candidatus Kerfeldbacteria bacterium]